MITFQTKSSRNPDVDGWLIQVEARYEPADEIAESHGLQEAMETAGADEDGLLIARLDCLLLHEPAMFDAKDLIETLDDHDGIGGTFDFDQSLASTSKSLISWAKNGGAESVFAVSDEPLQSLILSANFTVDPFIDRGAMLAVMVQHLSAFCPNRFLFVHEEYPEEALAEDQKNRMNERARAFRSIAGRVGFQTCHVSLGAEMAGREIGYVVNMFGEILPNPGDLPLIVASVPAGGPENPEWVIWDEEEIEIIDVVEWCQARLGVSLYAFDEPDAR